MADIDISRKTKLQSMDRIASKLGLRLDDIDLYGSHKAKIKISALKDYPIKKSSKLILVTAISPTPAGEGKTTTTVGLTDGLNKRGKNAVACLREPSLGPCFGMKGGATGGGYSQVSPMEDINLHLTGDFHAITSAHNLLAALLDNHIHHGNELGIDVTKVLWGRVVDMNDRALRDIVVGLGGKANGVPRESKFDITVASEVMAILCLATSIQDLKNRLGNILVAYRYDGSEVYASDLKAAGAMAVLLKDAIRPNLLQTLEGNPAIIHGGPFANIAHGCNSVLATKLGLGLADYVVTEAGFGADLGGEKFIDIKCRKADLVPSAVVLVATIRAIKYHGGVGLSELKDENVDAIGRGLSNLKKHYDNLTNLYGLNVVVALNKFISDTDSEIDYFKSQLEVFGAKVAICTHWSDGSLGAVELADLVVDMANQDNKFKLLYEDRLPLFEKIEKIAKDVYGADSIEMSEVNKSKLAKLNDVYGHFPICMAKTQYSFSNNPKLLGSPRGFKIEVRDIRVSRGAEFIVVVCGDLMTMPGLPKVPSSERIDLDEDGQIIGLD